MKSADKFLIGIITGIAILVIVVFAIAYLRPKPGYISDETPEGVIHNYFYALQQEDYGRAYSYLSPTIKGYPNSNEAFANDVHSNAWIFNSFGSDVSLSIISADPIGNNATVKVRKSTFNQGVLFGDEYSTTFDVYLQRVSSDSAWKIIQADEYWVRCWNTKVNCP
jgi:hypothetical protein